MTTTDPLAVDDQVYTLKVRRDRRGHHDWSDVGVRGLRRAMAVADGLFDTDPRVGRIVIVDDHDDAVEDLGAFYPTDGA